MLSFSRLILVAFSGLCFSVCALGQGGIFTYMACMMTTAANFSPKVRGTVIGLVDAMYGGSAAIFSAIYNQTYGKNDSPRLQDVAGFFYAAAITMISVNLFLFATLWWIPWEDQKKGATPAASSESTEIVDVERSRAASLNAKELKEGHVQGAEVRRTEELKDGADRSQSPTRPMCSADGKHSPLNRFATSSAESDQFSEHEPLLRQQESESQTGGSHNTQTSPDLNTLELISNVNFQFLFWSFALATGVGLMFMSNVLFFLKAYGLEEQYRGLFTIILPIFSLISRFLSGVISDALHSCYVSRSVLLVITMAVLVVAQALLLVWPHSVGILLFNAIAVGISYGSMWCLMPTIMTNIGGLKFFGQNWGIVMLSSALAGMGYQALYGKVYDAHVQRSTPHPNTVYDLVLPSTNDESPTTSTCYGTKCFALTTYITVASCAFSLLLVLLLCVRDQRELFRQKSRKR